MADRKVKTEFEADTSKFTGPAAAMAQQAQGLGSALMGLPSIAAAAFGALSGVGLAAAAKGIANIHAEFEDTKIAMGGFISALGLASNFTEGLQAAADAQQAITLAAAKLPGEAEDYIAVFKAGLPEVQGAIGGTLKDMYKFTNQLTAVTSTLGIESSQVARDVKLMLRDGAGAAGGHVKTFTQLLPFMKKLEGQTNLDSKAFNAMSQQARGALLQQVLTGGALNDMVTAAGNTWSAQIGSLTSNTKQLVRLGTGPLFDGMKDGLAYVNGLLYDSEGEMTDLSKTITAAAQLASGGLVDGFKAAFSWAGKMSETVVSMMEEMSHNEGINNIVNGAKGLLNGPSGMGAAAAGGAALAGAGPAALVIAPLVTAFSQPGFADKVFAPIVETFDLLSTLIQPIIGAFNAFNTVGTSLIMEVLPPLLNLFTSILDPLTSFAAGIIGVATYILNTAQPYLTLLFKSVGELASSLGDYLEPVLRIVGGVLIWLTDQIAKFLMPTINGMIDAIQKLIHYLAEAISWLGKKIGMAADAWFPKTNPNDHGPGATGGFLDNFMKSLQAQKDKNAAAEAAKAAATRQTAATATRSGGVTQNFPNARFDISQKFAEGFDPDRVAVAFAQDVGKLGEQKLQSGFEPAFGVH